MSFAYTLECGDLKGLQIDLVGECEEIQTLFQTALRKFQENVDWMSFDQWAFGQQSSLHKNMKSINSPIYRILKDIWLRLGKQQGKIK